MRHYKASACVTASLVLSFAANAYTHSGPFDGKSFKGRIAFSSDGNYNDEDDWGAFPVAAAILDAFGVTDRLVHVDYCNILSKNDPRFYKEMVESVLGSAERYNIPRSIFFDCQKDLDGAIESIKNAINASSTDDPLYYVLAGPMEVPYRGIAKSDPDKRKYVYCISHSSWNDGYTRSDRELHIHNKRDVISSGVNWIQCKDGNRNLAHPGGVGRRSSPEQWRSYHWLRHSSDPRLRWIFNRLEAEGRADVSDSTMTYFLLTGDEDADLTKLKMLLDDRKIPRIEDHRRTVRIEAENFRFLNGYAVEYGEREVSHRLNVRLQSTATGSITTTFNDIYTIGGWYDVEVRYFDEKDGDSELSLYVNRIQAGDVWHASADDNSWKIQTIPNVVINPGDEIVVAVQGDSGEYAKLDYMQLNYRQPAAARSGSSSISSSSYSGRTVRWFLGFMKYLAQKTIGNDFRNVKIYRCAAYPHNNQSMGYVVSCFGWEKNPSADVTWMSSHNVVRNKAAKVYLGDNEDGPRRMIIIKENDPGFGNLDVFNENQLADGRDGSQRVAQKRHRQGYNSLFLDWQVEYVNIDKQDARETRRLELRRWKWFYEGK
jgi:hypothetical protein